MAVRRGDSLRAPPGGRGLAWAAVVVLALALVVGALVFWLGIPALVLWTLSKLTDSSTTHFVLGMLCVPTGMALFAVFLTWLNGLYLRATDALRANAAADPRRRSEGPLVPLLVGAAIISLVALVIWFLFLAHSAFPEAPGGNSLIP
jgi:hypothetical protein